MAVQGISHVAVGVSDMNRALTFYRDLVGLRVTLDAEEGAFASNDKKGYRRRAVYLRTNDGPHEFFIVLDQQLDQPPFGQPPRILQLGTHHFSFWVDDLTNLFNRMVDAEFRVVLSPTEASAAAYGEDGDSRVLTAIVKDQDGNPVQFDQRL